MLIKRISRAKSDDAGSVTLLMITTILMTTLFATVLLYVGEAVCLQLKLANSADLVALGAAKEFLADQPSPCEVAKTVAHQNHVELVECQERDLSVSVKVMVTTPYKFRRVGVSTLTSRANAGF